VSEPIDSGNLFEVRSRDEGETIELTFTIKREQAINLAAWLAALADPHNKRLGATVVEILK